MPFYYNDSLMYRLNVRWKVGENEGDTLNDPTFYHNTIYGRRMAIDDYDQIVSRAIEDEAPNIIAVQLDVVEISLGRIPSDYLNRIGYVHSCVVSRAWSREPDLVWERYISNGTAIKGE